MKSFDGQIEIFFRSEAPDAQHNRVLWLDIPGPAQGLGPFARGKQAGIYSAREHHKPFEALRDEICAHLVSGHHRACSPIVKPAQVTQREIAAKTHTTKANVATALQMISWGLEVNDYGNAQLDADGGFIKVEGEGVTEEMWAEVVAYADEKGWKKGDYKNLNLPFENKFLAQPLGIRERMAQRVEDFVYKMLTKVLNTGGTAPLAVEAILTAGSYDLGAKIGRLEDPADWTDAKIIEKAKTLDVDTGAAGNFDD